VDKLNKEINASFTDAKMKAWFGESAAEPLPSSPSDFGQFIAAETGRNVKKVVNLLPRRIDHRGSTEQTSSQLPLAAQTQLIHDRHGHRSS
jgi:hypothetical protein